MKTEIYDLLNAISLQNYQCYLVGGFVRDFLLGFDNMDLDIVTDAPVEVVLNTFKKYNPTTFKYGTVKFKYLEYEVDIAQIRSEVYKDGNLVVTPIGDLSKDYLRRDFTFNSIYMDKDGKYFDFDDCINDCLNLKLKFVSDPNVKCIEDPTRVLRAIYFILKYNLKSYDQLFEVNISKELFENCDISALNKCMFKILKLGKYNEYINLLDKLDIYQYLFTNRVDKGFSKPIDFLKKSGYIFIDTLLNEK